MNQRATRYSLLALWALVVGLAGAGPAWPRDAEGDATCPYLRLSLSTPQSVQEAPGYETVQAEFLSVFGVHLERAGFEVSEPTSSGVAWEVFSQVELLGDGRLGWSYALLPTPGLADGMIEFPTFSVIDRPSGERVQFTTSHGLEHFRSSDFPLRAALASEKLANLYLPVALKLCAERGSSPELEEARLERIRRELNAEIERAAARRSQQNKHLDLKVDSGAQDARESESE